MFVQRLRGAHWGNAMMDLCCAWQPGEVATVRLPDQLCERSAEGGSFPSL